MHTHRTINPGLSTSQAVIELGTAMKLDAEKALGGRTLEERMHAAAAYAARLRTVNAIIAGDITWS